jgi:hypothetical protein
VSTAGGAFGYPSCRNFYTKDGLKAKEEKHKEWLREQEMYKKKACEDAKTWIHRADATILGLAINANTFASV